MLRVPGLVRIVKLKQLPTLRNRSICWTPALLEHALDSLPVRPSNLLRIFLSRVSYDWLLLLVTCLCCYYWSSSGGFMSLACDVFRREEGNSFSPEEDQPAV